MNSLSFPFEQHDLSFKSQPANHPVEAIQKNHYIHLERMRNFTLNNLFGSHMCVRLQMEKTILSQFQRLPTLHSEFVGLETIEGRDEQIDIDDYLNDPSESFTAVSDLHTAMEKKLGLGVDKLHLRV
eukprot:CAMPEP_0168550756 /NCGR_PEP_ID=MMETSP0413-20121227/5811_1 /TAXON_ID=136452 /ORGANISM="Filamoeba nolandi, Strain NC-AS-23-1" /LENGTH=126 /DNA_ID=CAMNT_0008581241 /DNA_START=30 /DNA_END=410 /DNA_ORIENTATION=-